MKTIDAHTDVLHLVFRPSLTTSTCTGGASSGSGNSGAGLRTAAGAAAASAVHASPFMGGAEKAGRARAAQNAIRVTQVLVVVLVGVGPTLGSASLNP